MRAFVIALVIAVLAGSAGRAESVHLADDHEIGAGAMIGALTGNLSGFTTGLGTFDDTRLNQLALQASIPLGCTHLDFDLRRLQSTTIARGAFSFDDVFFANGANVDLALTWLEVVWRFHLLDRPAMRIQLLGGGRVLRASVDAKTTTREASYSDLHVLPEIGASLEARIYPRAHIYGLIKYGDITSKTDGNHTLQIEGGLTYMVPAPCDDYIGFRVTGGFRYIDVQVTDRVGQVDQVQYDVSSTGPFLEAARAF